MKKSSRAKGLISGLSQAALQAQRNLAPAIVVKYSKLSANEPGLERLVSVAVESLPIVGPCSAYRQMELMLRNARRAS